MIWIPSGESKLGSDIHYPEERPATKCNVDGFWMDPSPITNRQFREFVNATGYVTKAELPPSKEAYPEIPPDQLRAGSAVFVQPHQPVDLTNPLGWWKFVEGAYWKAPRGKVSPRGIVSPRGKVPEIGYSLESGDLQGLENHPVVHIAFEDALAYASWANKELPTEQEWEYAARGGLKESQYVWGDELEPEGKPMANIWQGIFPHKNLKDTPPGTTPVKSYPPNGYGLFDMCGNVWEWTTDIYSNSGKTSNPTTEKVTALDETAVLDETAALDKTTLQDKTKKQNKIVEQNKVSACCIPRVSSIPQATGAPQTTINTDEEFTNDGQFTADKESTDDKSDFFAPHLARIRQRVIKGGSYLCSQNYCSRYRPAARIPETEDTSTEHIGFRCILRP